MASSSASSSSSTSSMEDDDMMKKKFKYIAKGTRHSIGIDCKGVAYSWGRRSTNNSLGQLGRRCCDDDDGDDGHRSKKSKPYPVELPPGIIASKAYVSQGCDKDSGHSAILDTTGQLWMTGCDRWQQLGLGSSKGGTSGYTWPGGGKLWSEQFIPSIHITNLMKEQQQQKQKQTKVIDSSNHDDYVSDDAATTTSATTPRKTKMMIRDVALGGDHTIILSSDQKTVYGFGKGGDGQLGLIGKPFVSAPVKSTILSTTSSENTKKKKKKIAAVCAVKACSFTLDHEGNIMKQVGKCRRTSVIQNEVTRCITRAEREGLLRTILPRTTTTSTATSLDS